MLRFLAIMVVAGAANPYIFIPVVVVVVLLLALRWYFLTTSREIKRLEAIGVLYISVTRCSEMWQSFTGHHPTLPLPLLSPPPPYPLLLYLARSPLYSHISATLQGLTTIRACEREQASVTYFHAYQDEQTKGWLHYLNSNRWFGMRIDLISSLFVTAVSFSAIPLAGGECCR